MGRALAVVLSIPLLLPPGGALADEHDRPCSPRPGDRLRVTAPASTSRPLVGTLIEITERELVLALSPSEHRVIPRAELTRVERSLGRRRHAKRGLLIGAASGATLLAVGGCQGETCTSQDVLLFASLGALLGALPGAAIGALVQTESWVELPSSDVRLTLAPVRGRGVALGLSWEW